MSAALPLLLVAFCARPARAQYYYYDNGLSTGARIGIAAGIAVLAIVTFLLLGWMLRRRRQRRFMTVAPPPGGYHQNPNVGYGQQGYGGQGYGGQGYGGPPQYSARPGQEPNYQGNQYPAPQYPPAAYGNQYNAPPGAPPQRQMNGAKV